ncbi:hypothetical protein NYV33_26570 [Escherichia coli]|nr:hypothetical protein [Escherichia coli]
MEINDKKTFLPFKHYLVERTAIHLNISREVEASSLNEAKPVLDNIFWAALKEVPHGIFGVLRDKSSM